MTPGPGLPEGRCPQSPSVQAGVPVLVEQSGQGTLGKLSDGLVLHDDPLHR